MILRLVLVLLRMSHLSNQNLLDIATTILESSALKQIQVFSHRYFLNAGRDPCLLDRFFIFWAKYLNLLIIFMVTNKQMSSLSRHNSIFLLSKVDIQDRGAMETIDIFTCSTQTSKTSPA